MNKARFFDWLLVAAWSFIIYFISDMPHLKTELGFLDLILRKIAHMVEFGILYFLFYRAVMQSFNLNPRGAFTASFIFCFLYAVSDEVHQSFVPGRTGSWKDVAFFDLAGILIASYLVKKWYRTRKYFFVQF